jgi:ESS family glutamate:Na+ symporter
MKRLFILGGIFYIFLFLAINTAGAEEIRPDFLSTIGIEAINVTSAKPATNLTVDLNISFRAKQNQIIDYVEVNLEPLESGLHKLTFDNTDNIWKTKITIPRGNLRRKNIKITATGIDGDKFSTNIMIKPTEVLVTPEVEKDGWRYVIDIALLSVFLLIGTFFKRKIRFFSKYLVPNAMIAGFVGLFVRWLIGTLFPNWGQLSIERLGLMIYHLMAVGFISLALKGNEEERNDEAVKTGASIVSFYIMQGIIGFAITLVLFYLVFPNLFPPFGLLLPLGYGQGPGQAYSIGTQWENFGFQYGGTIGLTVATFGFLWACFGGVPLMNWLIKKKKMMPTDSAHLTKFDKSKPKPIAIKDEPNAVPLTDSIDRMSIQAFLIGIAYLLTFGTLWLFSILLNPLGTFGQTLAQMLWGFHFILGSLFALLIQKSIKLFKNKEIMHRTYPNRYILERIAGGSFDFMITASIVALSWQAIKTNWLALLLLIVIGGVATMWYVVFLCKKVFKNHTLEYILALYGMATGTISSGLVLLKEVDPNFKTPAAQNMVLGSGVALFLGIPLILVLPIPVTGFVDKNPFLYLLTFILFFLLLAGLFLVIYFTERRRKKRALK